MYKKVLVNIAELKINMPPWHFPRLLQRLQELPVVTCCQALAPRALDADALIASHGHMDMNHLHFQEYNLHKDWWV
jgi:hypothetical protein